MRACGGSLSHRLRKCSRGGMYPRWAREDRLRHPRQRHPRSGRETERIEPVSDDKRIIEDYLPIEAISAEGSREKNVRRGHISTLHLWWARRPLVACRAAVYGALVPVSQFVPNGASDEKKRSLGRANAAKCIK